MVIGLADEPLLRHKRGRRMLQPYHMRAALVHDFLSSIRPGVEYEIVPLNEPLGPAATDSALQVCVCVYMYTYILQ